MFLIFFSFKDGTEIYKLAGFAIDDKTVNTQYHWDLLIQKFLIKERSVDIDAYVTNQISLQVKNSILYSKNNLTLKQDIKDVKVLDIDDLKERYIKRKLIYKDNLYVGTEPYCVKMPVSKFSYTFLHNSTS